MQKFTTLFLLTLLFLIPKGFSQEKTNVTIGGALRMNYNLSSWKDGQKKRGGDFGFDLFRINTKVEHEALTLNAEYRFYSSGFGGGMLKQGWVGYDLNENNNFQLGLTQVPFGLTTYNSNSWFFSINYYVGLEDDHDMGLKYSYTKDNWEMNLAFFKNAEELNFGSNSDVDASRYSYDVGSLDDDNYRNKEINQANAKLAYNIGEGDKTQQIGASGQFGGLYNLETEEIGNHFAFAGHYRANIKNFGLKAEVAYYKYNPEQPNDESNKQVAMVAYGASYMVAAEATTYTLGFSYNIPVKWEPISSIMVYNDFGLMDKAESSFEDSYMDVFGVLVSAGKVYTYIDYAMGKNQPWLGPDWTSALGEGNPDAKWEARFNVNVGYYF